MNNDLKVVYWDASALLSALVKDLHSDVAKDRAEQDAVHFISTLAYSEVCAVVSRLRRESILSDILIEAVFDVLDRGPWRRIAVSPQWRISRELSEKWSLRGADLWHLASAKSLLDDFPELKMLTFDARLKEAADGENLTD
ncbi:MAG: type II toxin-antitoxin system VapC family toxin [Proteobacteria bacterium]|nr:type II toxin-antitoxin system VapC family toxin [Pseudomonadota bacterium]